MVVGLLAILKAGAAYLPLDPAYPPERLTFMLEDSAPRLALIGRPTPDAVTEALANLHLSPTVLDLVADEALWANCSTTNLDSQSLGLTPRHLAYVIYTSGSTGAPKGAMVEHRGVVALAADRTFVWLQPGDRVAQAANASYDAVTFELWSVLLNGAEVHGLSRELTLSLPSFAEALRSDRFDGLFLTTALFNEVSAHDPHAFAGLSFVLFGGEQVNVPAVTARRHRLGAD